MVKIPAICLELNEPFRPGIGSEFLKPGSAAYEIACELRDLLKFELFRKHQLQVTSDVYVYYTVMREDSASEGPSSSWKRDVQGSTINMSDIGPEEDDFVVWGQDMRFGLTGRYQPYIYLAGLISSTSMQELREKELTKQIVDYLRLSVLDPERFEEIQDSFDRLKNELDELA